MSQLVAAAREIVGSRHPRAGVDAWSRNSPIRTLVAAASPFFSLLHITKSSCLTRRQRLRAKQGSQQRRSQWRRNKRRSQQRQSQQLRGQQHERGQLQRRASSQPRRSRRLLRAAVARAAAANAGWHGRAPLTRIRMAAALAATSAVQTPVRSTAAGRAVSGCAAWNASMRTCLRAVPSSHASGRSSSMTGTRENEQEALACNSRF